MSMSMPSCRPKVVVFNPSGQCADEFNFVYEGQLLERVQEFKYRGVVFHATREHAAANARHRTPGDTGQTNDSRLGAEVPNVDNET